MYQLRETLLAHLKSLKAPVGAATVQTMDMGVEYIAASADGARTGVGLWSVWPVLGPFALQDDERMRLKEIAVGSETDAPFRGMQIDYVWQHVLLMFDYIDMTGTERLAFQQAFARAVLEQNCRPSEGLYVYFDSCCSDLPLFFEFRSQAINYFMLQAPLVPWDEMSTDELEMWSEMLEEVTEFSVVSPFANEDVDQCAGSDEL